MASEGANDENTLEPAEYKFHNKKFHDCHLTVGDPTTSEVEVFGVVTLDLVAHSTVFRDLLLDSKLADPTGANTHITDVTPEVFKLMLRHVYGGKLPDMSQETAIQLVFCADKYNIQSLLERTSKLLTPVTVGQVYQILPCVVYIHLHDLEQQVTKFIQEQTDELIKSKQFLDLDENCMEFIAKQENLAITEIELWRSVLKWAEKQTGGTSDLRQHIKKPLQHIRLLTLIQDEIVKEIMPTNILNPPELMSLLSALTNNESLDSLGLCSIRNARGFSKTKYPDVLNTMPVFKHTFKFDCKHHIPNYYTATNFKQLSDYDSSSTFTITSKGIDIELQSFQFKSRPLGKGEEDKLPYDLTYVICVYKNIGGICELMEIIKGEGLQVIHNEGIDIPLKLKNGQFLKLNCNWSYYFVVKIFPPHPVYTTEYSNSIGGTLFDSTYQVRSTDHMSVKFNTPLHVRSINYKY